VLRRHRLVGCEQGTWFLAVLPPAKRSARSMSATYLEKLNPEQRRAVEHGVGESATDADHALLVIAGLDRARRVRTLIVWCILL
jgi:hypothetical protein